ncbi:MAG: WecB/TagA/CpsF family glycosyltransferase, partial [Kiritimatiellae bacterium]|nr:WecB/TagA/CpsF family glycosyltransferase [Kiritimatiellia bacterium]
ELVLVLEPGVEPSDVVADGNPPPPAWRAPRLARRPVLSMLWHLLVLPFRIRRHRNEFDGFVLCVANRRVCAFYPLPTVATVHDLATWKVAGKYSSLRMFYARRILPVFARNARTFAAVSQSTKDDMVRFWKCQPDDIEVLYEGPGDVSGEIQVFDHPSNGSGILYISRIENPGKNHIRLVEAYERLPRELAEAHRLVFVGADWNGADAVHDRVSVSPYAKYIRFAGFAPEDALETIWAQSGYYVFPSLFEGFGLSLVEAMARGLSCACSKNGSLGELGRGVALTFDPYDVEDMARTLQRLLVEPAGERAARMQSGFRRAACFSWERHAEGLVRLLDDDKRPSPCAASVFGVRIDADTSARAIDCIRSGGGKFLAFANAHCLNVSRADGRYRAILKRECDKVWPDGIGVEIAGKALGFAIPENLCGTDLVPAAMAAGGLSFWFLGGRAGVAQKALEKCAAAYPQSRFLGAMDGYQDDWGDAIAKIREARPDVLLVAMGVPIQEKWIAAHRNDLPEVGCFIAVGGLLDNLSGRIPRAPRFVRALRS